MLYRAHLTWTGFEFNKVVVGTECKGRW
jgi:hypothetical protein